MKLIRSRMSQATTLWIYLALAPALAAASTPEDGARSLGLQCTAAQSADGVRFVRCTGELPSFDGLPLALRIIIPEGAAAPLPTVLFLHSFGGNSAQVEAETREGNGAATFHFNATWWVSQGYAVIAASARGFSGSCGITDFVIPDAEVGNPVAEVEETTCLRGWTHAAERDYETRDSQHLLSLAVDAGISDPERLAATGISYGGGLCWLLATAEPWQTPGGTVLQLAAAAPVAGWTDIQNSFLPNGRATDHPDRRRSHEAPYGVLKASWAHSLLGGAASFGTTRYNTLDPEEIHSYLPGWFAVWDAGESYERPDAAALAAAFRNKSAYYADDYLVNLLTGAVRPVPIYAAQGWNDALFPPVEALQMYRLLNAVDPEYPIWMAFGDIGHGGRSAAQMRHVNDQISLFLNAVLLGDDAGAPVERALAFVTECPNLTETPRFFTAGEWDELATGGIKLTKDGDPRTTRSGPPNLAEEAATDPLVWFNVLQSGQGFESGIEEFFRQLEAGGISLDPVLLGEDGQQFGPCVIQPPGAYDADRAWKWPVRRQGFTLLGLPRVRAKYELDGADATVAVKLWRAAADGTRTLVTRGVYRLSLAGGDAREGTIDFQLFGNAFEFHEGQSIHLEFSQTDFPFLRPNNAVSRIRFTSPELRLPIVE